MDKKKLRNDLILIISLLLVAVIALVIILVNRKKDNLVAKVYVQSEIVLTIDLNEVKNEDYYIDGVHNQVHINVKDGAIAIVESGCPHQDCVHTGYVKESNRPIICAYNAVYIIIEGTSNYDVVVN